MCSPSFLNALLLHHPFFPPTPSCHLSGANPLHRDTRGRTPRQLAEEIQGSHKDPAGVPRGDLQSAVAILKEAEWKVQLAAARVPVDLLLASAGQGNVVEMTAVLQQLPGPGVEGLRSSREATLGQALAGRGEEEEEEEEGRGSEG